MTRSGELLQSVLEPEQLTKISVYEKRDRPLKKFLIKKKTTAISDEEFAIHHVSLQRGAWSTDP